MDRSNDDFERVVRGLHFEGSPGGDHRQDLRHQVLAAYDRSQQAPWSVALFMQLQFLWRWIMFRPIPRFAVPVLAVALVAAGFFLLTPARPSFAFENLIEPLLTAKSARCTAIVQMKGQPAMTFISMFRGTVSRQEHKDMGSVMIQDAATGTTLSLAPKAKKAMILQAVNREPEQSEGSGFLHAIREQLLALQADTDGETVSLGERKEADRTLIGFRVTNPVMQTEIWGDQETGLPHTIISSMAPFPNSEITFTDFEFDVELDDSLFSLVPPAGYAVTKDTIDLSKPTEEVFIAALRQFTDLSDGGYPDSIDMQEGIKVVSKQLAGASTTEKGQQELARVMKIVARGVMFPLSLHAEADAAYAGKGASRDDGKKPIFWYKPEGKDTYRVILADLSVIDSDDAPQADDVQRFTDEATALDEAK